MIVFPYMQLPTGIARPIIAIGIAGPHGRRLLDGLLDTGSDRTIFPQCEATAVGVQLPLLPDGSVKTAGGLVIDYRLGEVLLELRTAGATLQWKSEVAFAEHPMRIIHLGTQGFLEYFHATFMGPEQKVMLDPRPSLPTAGP